MLSKTLTMILVGASVAFAAPVAAIAEPVAPPPPAAEATVINAALTKTDDAAAAKKPAKKAAKKKSKKAEAKAEPAPEPKKPGGLFGALFGGPVKKEEPAKPMTKAEKAKAAKAAKAAEAAEKAEKAKAAKAVKAAEAAEKAEKAKAARAAADAEKAEKIRLAKAAEDKARAEEEQIRSIAATAKNNSGELRSETAEVKPQGFFEAVFGGSTKQKIALLEETKALDAALAIKDRKAKFRVKSEFEPQRVDFPGYTRGQIVIDTAARYLYLIESGNSARRYAIAVGKDGLQFKGTVTVGDKQEWPRWTPTKEMQIRSPAKYGRYKEGMDGGTENPLGARAIYLYQGKKDTHLRIHGTTDPGSIGTSASNGCFRMINEHVIDLYTRVPKGTQVIVL